jgi:hypothetical protein
MDILNKIAEIEQRQQKRDIQFKLTQKDLVWLAISEKGISKPILFKNWSIKISKNSSKTITRRIKRGYNVSNSF